MNAPFNDLTPEEKEQLDDWRRRMERVEVLSSQIREIVPSCLIMAYDPGPKIRNARGNGLAITADGDPIKIAKGLALSINHAPNPGVAEASLHFLAYLKRIIEEAAGRIPAEKARELMKTFGIEQDEPAPEMPEESDKNFEHRLQTVRAILDVLSEECDDFLVVANVHGGKDEKGTYGRIMAAVEGNRCRLGNMLGEAALDGTGKLRTTIGDLMHVADHARTTLRRHKEGAPDEADFPHVEVDIDISKIAALEINLEDVQKQENPWAFIMGKVRDHIQKNRQKEGEEESPPEKPV